MPGKKKVPSAKLPFSKQLKALLYVTTSLSTLAVGISSKNAKPCCLGYAKDFQHFLVIVDVP